LWFYFIRFNNHASKYNYGLICKVTYQAFAKSCRCVNECCSHLIPFFKAVAEGNWKEANALRETISRLERDADQLKRDIRIKLPRGLFMPVDRTDMLDLLTQQDKLANLAKDIAGRMIGREFCTPASMQADMLTYVARCLDAAKQAQHVIEELDELLETGFKGREISIVADMINELDAIEDDTDNMQIALRQKLMAVEDDYNTIDVIFFYKVIEWVGGIADQAQRVGARLELMLSRS
jgi:hypothetical protein